MLIQYSRRAQRALAQARDEAGRRGAGIVGTEHLLLALLADPHGVAWRVIDRLTDRAGAMGDDLRAVMPPDVNASVDAPSQSDENFSLDLLPLTDEAQRAVGVARDESRGLGEFSVGTGHLLLGLLAETGTPAARSLLRHGINSERVKQEMAREQEP